VAIAGLPRRNKAGSVLSNLRLLTGFLMPYFHPNWGTVLPTAKKNSAVLRQVQNTWRKVLRPLGSYWNE
jgi:hypothetical protein